MSYNIVAGDLYEPLEIDGADASGAVNLTDATSVQMRWKKPDGTTSLVDLVIIDAPTGRVKKVWSAGDTDQVGVHRAQVVVTWPTAEPQTFPEDGSAIIFWVNAALA